MSDTQLVHEVMSQIGPILDLAEVNESTEIPVWTLVWDDGTLVLAEYDEETRRITLSADVGAVPETGFMEFASMLLQYNGLRQQTGGISMGTTEGRVLQMYDMSVTDLEVTALAGILASFVEKAISWEAVVANAASGMVASPNGPPGEADMLISAGIRV